MARKRECYLCSSDAVSREHVPAQCFFPEDFRVNLVTVPSCEKHNNDTTLDDEYIRYVIAMSHCSNKIAVNHYKGKISRSSKSLENLVTKNPNFLKLNKEDDSTQSLTFEVDRERFNRTIKKIAYGLYYHKYNKTWGRVLEVSTEHLITLNYEKDVIATYAQLQKTRLKNGIKYEGSNPKVFQFSILEFPNLNEEAIIMNFYENFEVWAFPVEKTFAARV